MPTSSAWFYIITCAFVPALLLTTAMMAGLSHGFATLDATHLAVLKQSGTVTQRRIVGILEPLQSRHHWVLVSMVLVHALADEALPIVLERVCNEYIAVSLSVPLVIFFGELLPAVVFGGPRQLHLLAAFSWLVWLATLFTSFVSLPLSWMLDWWIGKKHKVGMSASSSHLPPALLVCAD